MAFNTNSGNVEVMIDNATLINEVADKFQIENQSFNIAQTLRKECQRYCFIDVTAKVPKHFKREMSSWQMNLGLYSLVLGKERAVNFNFHVNDVIRLENGIPTTFNNNI